jgi:hypothetical protein
MNELKVYSISVDTIPDGLSYQDITDQDFMNYAEFEGTVYSLRGFENAINQDDFDFVNSIIRFI